VSRSLTPEQVRIACATYYSQDAADATVAYMRRLEGLVNYYNQCGDVTALSGPVDGGLVAMHRGAVADRD
jgi:hypothetical protein